MSEQIVVSCFFNNFYIRKKNVSYNFFVYRLCDIVFMVKSFMVINPSDPLFYHVQVQLGIALSHSKQIQPKLFFYFHLKIK